MNIKQIFTIGIAGMAMGTMALDKVEVTGVTARQRYPWNGLVDIDFTTDSKPTEPYQMNVVAFDNVGKTNLPVKSTWTEDVSQKDNPCMVRADTRRILWDAAADLPNGFKCTNVLVSCRDERLEDDSKRYMIIDLSSGSSASSYPVSYTNSPPPGGWTEEFMTTKLVLRRVDAGSFYMGSPASDAERQANEAYHEVTLTSSFYMSIYKITSAQYSLVSGGTYDDIKCAQYAWNVWRGWDTGNSESLDNATTVNMYDQTCLNDPSYIRFRQKKQYTSYCWPQSSAVDSSSFLGKLRNRTNLNFDLPTEAQWEYASRAGSIMPLNTGFTNSTDNAYALYGVEYTIGKDGVKKVYVGNNVPNALGLYDMNNKVGEWCLDAYVANLGNSSATDPIGASATYEEKTISMGTDKYLSSDNKYFTYNGNVYWTQYCANIPVTFVGYGVRRSVRGLTARAAARSSALILNTTGLSYKSGMTNNNNPKQTLKASYSNQSHCLRLTLTVGD